MTGILFDTPPLVAVGAIFLLALVGAVVLFRFLKATAVFKTVQGQASGALAGFLMIFGALDGTYMHLAPGSAEMEELRSTIVELEARLAEVDTELWTFTGRVGTPEGSRPADVEVRVLPPAPLTLVDGGRDFRLEHVEVVQHKVYTDPRGRFAFRNLDAGAYDLRIRYGGRVLTQRTNDGSVRQRRVVVRGEPRQLTVRLA